MLALNNLLLESNNFDLNRVFPHEPGCLVYWSKFIYSEYFRYQPKIQGDLATHLCIENKMFQIGQRSFE